MTEFIDSNFKTKVLEIRLFYWKSDKATNQEIIMKIQNFKNWKK